MLGKKRAGKEQQQEFSKKQIIEEDKESDEVDEASEDDEGELMKHLVIKKDDDIAIDFIPLATKLLVIIDYKLHKEACVDIVWKLLVHQGGSPAGIHGLFSGWYCGLASRKVTLGVSMAWAKGVTTGTLVRYETSCGRLLGLQNEVFCVEFEQMMHKKFQMSSMGELTFFLGLQVRQKDDGIFISQDKYVADTLKKFDFVTVKTTSTPIETNKALL
ncbi:uncharacterized mitochondrial protein-like protein [Tanacetum coccineum]